MTDHTHVFSEKTNVMLFSSNMNGYAPDLCTLFRTAAQKPKVLYIGYALENPDTFIDQMKKDVAGEGITIVPAHAVADPRAALQQADGVFVEGGNTFRLRDELAATGLLPEISRRAKDGMPYAGISAGATIAGPTTRTSNDTPPKPPVSYDALGILPFQIMPHYEEAYIPKITAFHASSDTPLLGLRNTGGLSIEAGRLAFLPGRKGPARLFMPGKPSANVSDAPRLLKLLNGGA
jgi:dipeptidase E